MFSLNYSLDGINNKLIAVAVMTIIWTLLYVIVHFLYNPNKKVSKKTILDTKNRIISIVHGVGSFVMAC